MGQWKSGCKRCGKKIEYSDRSYKVDLEKGFSRPEYCQEHQAEEVKTRSEMGIAYVSVKVKKGVESTSFGKLNHPGQNHSLSFKKGNFVI